MKTELEHLLKAGEDLIGQIAEVRKQVEWEVEVLGGNLKIDRALCALSDHAADLQRHIDAARVVAPHLEDPVAAATAQAIDNLLTLLTEAKAYFATGRNLAAIGTLVMFDDHAEDLRAAFRLCRMAQRRRS